MSSEDQYPNSSLWTIRFKYHKKTVLLYVDRTASFDVVKTELLAAITNTGITEINGQPVPDDPSDIILGVPMDKYDHSKGFVEVEISDLNGYDEPVEGKRKSGAKPPSVVNSTPQGAGLKDGQAMAFRFRGDENDKEGKFDVRLPTWEEDQEGLRASPFKNE